MLLDNGAKRTGTFERKAATEAGGRWAMDNLTTALALAKAGEADAILFAPLNKSSLHMGGMGPFPSDTIFIKAFAGDFDGVLTMYHDQGQIAMKLKGFDGGVTMQGGLPVPICTPAHGTAFDLVGRGVADTASIENAFALATRLGTRRRAAG